MIEPLCSICGKSATVVYVYKTTSGEILGKDSLCRNHEISNPGKHL